MNSEKKGLKIYNMKEISKRKLSVCPHQKTCGGCDYPNIPYKEQLSAKEDYVRKCLLGLCKVDPIIGMENPTHYRNKVTAEFAHKKDGAIISGRYRERSHQVIPVENCLIEDEIADSIILEIRDLLKSFKIKVYSEVSGYGLLRHVLIRRGFVSGEVMVVLVLTSPILPSKNNFVKALRKVHPEISTVIINVNDKPTSMVLGERNITLYGKGYIQDQLCGLTFRISPSSFYQVNPVQTEILYQKALELASLTGKERVLDAYCGIGTIGMTAAAGANEVIGIELNKAAIKDAVINARQNKIKNITFYQGDAGKFMQDLARESEKIDLVFMDPPRSGSDDAFLMSLVKLKPERVIYISCNPETLARDLKYLTKHGYHVVKAVPVDMFAYTAHLETIVSLQRGNL